MDISRFRVVYSRAVNAKLSPVATSYLSGHFMPKVVQWITTEVLMENGGNSHGQGGVFP